MRRNSRKKQGATSSREEEKTPPAVSGGTRRQQLPQEILQQQRKKYHDEITSLTTKNYRLAKELADLRLKHRDESKHVTRLTMENMNLASRCREAISHVAMLKKELAMQQKRTAQALASQREQTKRMTDNLTNSFICFSSPDSVEPQDRITNKKNHRSNCGMEEDENVRRLVSTTPSPDRDALHECHENKHAVGNNDGNESQVSEAASASAHATRLTSSIAIASPTHGLKDDKTIVDGVPLVSSTLRESPEDEDKNLGKKPHFVYSTPKKVERTKIAMVHVESNNEFDDAASGKELFPISASPQMLSKSNSNYSRKSYNDGFPSHTMDQPQSDCKRKYENFQRKMNLMNSIDAFEQSFATDFPDSFTPKHGNSGNLLHPPESGQTIYNPFLATPEKRRPPSDINLHSKPIEQKVFGEPSKISQIDYKTPPKNSKIVPLPFDENRKNGRPRRPEKNIPLVARARYERALGPRIESSTQSNQPIVNGAGKNLLLDSSSSGPTFRSTQQKKEFDKYLEPSSNISIVKDASEDLSSSSEQNHLKFISNAVDILEQNGCENGTFGKPKKSSTLSQFPGPIKNLRRRSVKTPISYAEPPLNTKIRRGDTFFPKASPTMTASDIGDLCDDQNQVLNLLQPAAIVSP